MAKFSTSVDALKTRHSQLTAKRDAAERAVAKATEARQRNLLDGDIDDTKTATQLQAAVDSASSSLAGFDDALATLAQQIEDAQRALDDEKSKIARKAASEEILTDVAYLEKELPPVFAALRKHAVAINKYASFRAEMGAISAFTENAINELEVALGVSLPDLKVAAKAVEEGREKPPVPLAAVVKFIAPKPPPLTCVFAMQNLKYDDTNGQLIRFPKMNLCDLPPELAARALKLQWAIPLSDPRVKKLNGSYGSQIPAAQHCCDLDTGMSSTVAPVLASSPFEPHPTRPHHGLIPEQRAPMVAARSAPVEKPED